jgi:hypothetical protein
MSANINNTRPHLILNFDINGTLIALDTNNDNKQNHDVVSTFIAEKYKDIWDSSLTKPISYYDYVKFHQLPNPSNSLEIKTLQKEVLSKTIEDFKERKFSQFDSAQCDYDAAMTALKVQKTIVFNSFFKLINHLNETQQPFTLILRTFGPDAPKIAKVLQESEIGIIVKEFHNIIQGTFKIDDVEEDLYEYIKEFSEKPDEHLAIRDEYKWWFENGEKSRFGKAFPVDLKDRRFISIFFDDCSKFNEDRPDNNILNPYDPVTKTSLSIKELIEKHRIFPVDTVKAICEEDYYIELVKEALFAHSINLD